MITSVTVTRFWVVWVPAPCLTRVSVVSGPHSECHRSEEFAGTNNYRFILFTSKLPDFNYPQEFCRYYLAGSWNLFLQEISSQLFDCVYLRPIYCSVGWLNAFHTKSQLTHHTASLFALIQMSPGRSILESGKDGHTSVHYIISPLCSEHFLSLTGALSYPR